LPVFALIAVLLAGRRSGLHEQAVRHQQQDLVSFHAKALEAYQRSVVTTIFSRAKAIVVAGPGIPFAFGRAAIDVAAPVATRNHRVIILISDGETAAVAFF
jgi:hypothetical protein